MIKRSHHEKPLKEPLSYHLSVEFISVGKVTEAIQETVAKLEERSLILSINGKPRDIPYFTILGIKDVDYKIDLTLVDGESIRLTRLGYDYETFLLNLYKKRGEQLLRYMLMNENNLAQGISAHFVYVGDDCRVEGQGEARIYESAVIIVPQKSDPIRIPLCYIRDHDLVDYVTSVELESGDQLTLTMMGEKTDYFTRILSKAIRDMIARAATVLIENSQLIEKEKIFTAASRLSDGRAVSKSEIDTISPSLWGIIEDKIKQTNIWDEYEYLKTFSGRDVWVGVKRGLMGEVTGDYIWFMQPIYDPDPSKAGNVVVLEAASGEELGRATYLFRMMSRQQYNKGVELDDLTAEVKSFTYKANRCMIDINFRREPIYMSWDRLNTPEYEGYLYAVKKSTSLRFLRERYIGRVAHTTPEQWKSNIEELLKFNVKSQSDSDIWRR
jgi:hypothetical protein